ncbi:MAG: prepilin-type N-terminal cleavage/methylation domain-containing protein [Verrucomicrobia bacterium]|nr:prepilin-type N-terminal cleavage/methylation domain-containing protein [Verrucomicrobiota bacterium]
MPRDPSIDPHAPGRPTPAATAKRAAPPTGGFTLLELLLAAAVFAVVLLAVHGVFYGALRLQQKTVGTLERSLPLQRALAIVKRDLAGIVVPGGTFFGQLQTAYDSASTNATNLLYQSASIPGPGAILQGLATPAFYTASSLISDTAPWGEVGKVYYHLVDPTNHSLGKDLFRSVTRNLLPLIQEEPEDQWLMSGVDYVFFSFYDGTQWLESWDSEDTTTPPLPEAIRVHLQLASQDSQDNVPEPVELIVPILVQAATNQSVSASDPTQEASP